jgi:2'-5' RNA ligase
VRAFVAIELNEGARAAVVAEQRRIATVIGTAREHALRWVRQEHLHLTLAFFPDVDEALVPVLVETMRADMDVEPFSIVFEGIGVFSRRSAPQTLWLGVSAGGGSVADVQRRMASRARDVGLELEQRVFHPHLTLARWRRSTPADHPRLVLAAASAKITTPVTHVTLFRSVLSPHGPTHEPLARATLTACRS